MTLLHNQFLHFLLLFGVFQGFTLCFYVWFKRKINPKAAFFFILFLFCLAYFNLKYALIFTYVKEAWYNAIMGFPIPYKYLIGVGVYFYLKYHFPRKDGKSHFRNEWYLLLPAFASEVIYLYWYYLKNSGINENILLEVHETGFFAAYELAYLLFNIWLGFAALRFMRQNQEQYIITTQSRLAWKSLRLFLQVFLFINAINLTNQIISLFYNLEENIVLYAVLLLLNTAYIYWIGFLGYLRPQLLFKPFPLKAKLDEKLRALNEKLQQLLQVEQLFKHPDLKIADVALRLEVSVKELSALINENYQMNFSEFVNHYRLEDVKRRLLSPESEKYTLLSIANESGFRSKSSFNVIFKKATGLTPKAYKQKHSQ